MDSGDLDFLDVCDLPITARLGQCSGSRTLGAFRSHGQHARIPLASLGHSDPIGPNGPIRRAIGLLIRLPSTRRGRLQTRGYNPRPCHTGFDPDLWLPIVGGKKQFDDRAGLGLRPRLHEQTRRRDVSHDGGIPMAPDHELARDPTLGSLLLPFFHAEDACRRPSPSP